MLARDSWLTTKTLFLVTGSSWSGGDADLPNSEGNKVWQVLWWALAQHSAEGAGQRRLLGGPGV